MSWRLLPASQTLFKPKVLGVMRMGFDCAVENGLIFRSPCAKIKAGGVPTEEKVPLTPEQCAALEDATKGTRAYLFVLIGLYTGLRREEICGLRWSDLDLNAAAPHLTVNNAVRFDGGRASSLPAQNESGSPYHSSAQQAGGRSSRCKVQE